MNGQAVFGFVRGRRQSRGSDGRRRVRQWENPRWTLAEEQSGDMVSVRAAKRPNSR